MIVIPDMDVYTEIQNQQKTHWKTSKKRKKQQPTEKQNNIKYRNYNLSGGYIVNLSCQGGGSHPCSLSVMPLIIGVCTFHDGCKQGIDQQIFNRKSISRRITHPQSFFK